MASSAVSWKPVPRGFRDFLRSFNRGQRRIVNARRPIFTPEWQPAPPTKPVINSDGKRSDSYGLKWKERNKSGKSVIREKFFNSHADRESFLKSQSGKSGFCGAHSRYN